MRRPRSLIALLVTAVLALATGCGAAGEQSGGGPRHAGGNGDGGKISIRHAKGTTTLDAPARRVVALEWTYAEDLMALGVTPTGVADIKGYEQWVTAGPRIDDDVKDVGTRQEPSLETIRQLDPDLIITSALRSEGNYAELRKIAPTVMFDPYAASSEYTEMRATLRKIGTAVGKANQAEQALADLDRKIAAARKRLAEAGRDGDEVTVARGYTTDGAAVAEVMTDSTIPGGLLPELGLRNAWRGKPDAHGMSKIDIEGFRQVEKSHLVYVAAPEDDVFAKDFAKNRLWRRLDFVTGDRVHALDPGTWYFGGPFATGQIAEEIADALAP